MASLPLTGNMKIDEDLSLERISSTSSHIPAIHALLKSSSYFPIDIDLANMIEKDAIACWAIMNKTDCIGTFYLKNISLEEHPIENELLADKLHKLDFYFEASIALDPSHHHKNLGARCLNHITHSEDHTNWGCHTIYIVDNSNSAAIGLMQKTHMAKIYRVKESISLTSLYHEKPEKEKLAAIYHVYCHAMALNRLTPSKL